MEKVVLSFSGGHPFYCPFCGTQTLPEYEENKDMDFKKCKHLLYFGSNEGGFEIISDEIRAKISKDMDEEELIELEIENALHFSLCEPPPSTFGSFIGYKK